MDLYQLLGVRRNASVGRDPPRLPEARAPAPSRPQPGRSRRRRAVPRGLRAPSRCSSDPQRRAPVRPRRGARRAPSARARGRLRGLRLLGRGAAWAAPASSEIFDGRPAPARGRGARRAAAARTSSSRRAIALRGVPSTAPRRRVHLVRLDRCAGLRRARASVAIGPRACPRLRGQRARCARSRGRMIFTRPLRASAAASGVARRRAPAAAARARAGSCRASGSRSQIPAGRRATAAACACPGRATPAAAAGPPGDFVLVVQVEPHPVLPARGRRPALRGARSPSTEAALGAHVEVPTPDGPGRRSRSRRAPRPASASACASAGCRGWARRAAATSTSRPGCGCPRVRDDESRELLREFARRNPARPARGAAARRAAGAKGR